MKDNGTVVAVESLQSDTKTLDAATTLSWSNVGYSLPMPKSNAQSQNGTKGSVAIKKHILSDISGLVRAGEVVAIMGGSGAGKSTLLNTLAGRIGAGTLKGEILVNGKPRDPATWPTDCAYVEQDDLMYTTLTVEETLMYSAFLRLPSDMSFSERIHRVNDTIMDLGLNGCRHARIGSIGQCGISGGERKRVSIGIELVADPKILFLDEPTSGLDAFTALNILENIKQLAVKQSKIVLMTIHQPRADILELCDNISLLSNGTSVWFGSTSDALDHFFKLGYGLPEKTNPGDHFIDVVTLDQQSEMLRQSSLERIQKFVEAWRSHPNRKRLQGSDSDLGDSSTGTGNNKTLPISTHRNTSPPMLRHGNHVSWLVELRTLLQRNVKNEMRSIPRLLATLIQSTSIMLLLGFVFYKSGNDYMGIQNKVGVLYFMCINLTFSIVMPTLTLFPLERTIIARERAAGTYSASAVFIAKWISTLPMLFLSTLILVMPVYWMIGLTNDMHRYGTFIVIMLVHSNAANGLGLVIGSSVKNIQIGQIIAPLIVVVFLLFGGPLVNLDSTPDVFKWVPYVSIITVSNKALAQNEFLGAKFECPNPTSICYRDGQQVIDTYVLGSPTKWVSVGQNLVIMTVFLILAFSMFKHTSRPMLRLV
ncbi:hypothetical protein BASA62_008687 [Batrachochytrium salamandrivorans]|nr:hypothetical protein BASA62_008687 [Batrachochytrium salamandrivorans]